jgi:hypothetical protein
VAAASAAGAVEAAMDGTIQRYRAIPGVHQSITNLQFTGHPGRYTIAACQCGQPKQLR